MGNNMDRKRFPSFYTEETPLKAPLLMLFNLETPLAFLSEADA